MYGFLYVYTCVCESWFSIDVIYVFFPVMLSLMNHKIKRLYKLGVKSLLHDLKY